jgi:putative transposase
MKGTGMGLGMVKVASLLGMAGEWNAFLPSAIPGEQLRDIRRYARTGRRLGGEAFVGRLEALVGRVLKPQKRGPKRKQHEN